MNDDDFASSICSLGVLGDEAEAEKVVKESRFREEEARNYQPVVAKSGVRLRVLPAFFPISPFLMHPRQCSVSCSIMVRSSLLTIDLI